MNNLLKYFFLFLHPEFDGTISFVAVPSFYGCQLSIPAERRLPSSFKMANEGDGYDGLIEVLSILVKILVGMCLVKGRPNASEVD